APATRSTSPLPPSRAPLPPPPPGRAPMAAMPSTARATQPPSPRTIPPPLPRALTPGANGFPAPGSQAATLTLVYLGERFPITKDRFVIGRGKQSSDLTL